MSILTASGEKLIVLMTVTCDCDSFTIMIADIVGHGCGDVEWCWWGEGVGKCGWGVGAV